MIDGIHRFGKLLQNYFEVVDIFVSSRPEYAAIAWGAIRLALKVSPEIREKTMQLIRLMWSMK